MLLHRLVLDKDFNDAAGDGVLAPEMVRRVNLRVAAAGLLTLDTICLIAACIWLLPGQDFLAVRAAPVCAWIAASCAASLYGRHTLRCGRRQVHAVPATCCMAAAPWTVLALLPAEHGERMLAVWMVQAICAVTLRATWGVGLFLLLGQGYCLERAIVIAPSLSAARVLSASLERRTRGQVRVVLGVQAARFGGACGLAQLEALLHRFAIDRAVIVGGANLPGQQTAFLARLARAGAALSVLHDDGAPCLYDAPEDVLPRLDEAAPPLSQAQSAWKRNADIILAGLALLWLAPVLAVVALAVRLDSPGQTLFRQTRVGLNGRPFKILKFRTMLAAMEDPHGMTQTTRGDKRVTRVGRLLRMTSLDELPQLVNVLLGDMSLVGPRPHTAGMIVDGRQQDLVRGYHVRLRIKPGITGWAQVNGSRGNIDTVAALRRRIALDCHYIENWSLRLDLAILCRTVFLVFRDRHAF